MAKDETTTLLLLGGLGVGGYFLWKGGSLNQFLPDNMKAPVTATAASGPPVQQLSAAQLAAIAASNAPASSVSQPSTPTVPALGTTIISLPQALAQIKAKDPFIVPNLALYTLLQTQIPANSGYNFYVAADGTPLLLRDDVLAAVSQTADGQAGAVNLDQIKKMMTTAGLSGYRDLQRHMFTRTARY